MEPKQSPVMEKPSILTESVGEKSSLLRDLTPEKNKKGTEWSMKQLGVSAVIIIICGLLSGFLIARIGGGGTVASQSGSEKTADGLAKTVGIKDVGGKDTVEGVVREGGIEGEGTHHLERPGGPSQNVYLVSSVVPLSDYVEKEVKVWGDTFAAQSAGWFMDVVRLELVQ